MRSGRPLLNGPANKCLLGPNNVAFCDAEPRDQPSYRGERRESSVPLFPGLEGVARGDRARALLVPGPARGPGRAAGAGAPAPRGHARLGGVAVPEPSRTRRCSGSGRPSWTSVSGASASCRQRGLRFAPGPGRPAAAGAAPIDAATAEADHVVPVHQAFYGQRQALQALCLECHRSKTFLQTSHATSLESRLCRHVHETYACSPRLPPLVCGLAKCDPDRVCQGVDIVRCRKNALANAPFPLPIFCPLDNIRPAEEGHLADLTFVQEGGPACGPGRAPALHRPGLDGKPATAFIMLDSGLATWADLSGPWTPPPTSRRTASPGHWRSWREPGPRARSTWPSSPSTLSSDSGLGPRTSSTPCAPPITRWTAGAGRPGPVPLRPRLRRGALLQAFHAARPRFRECRLATWWR